MLVGVKLVLLAEIASPVRPAKKRAVLSRSGSRDLDKHRHLARLVYFVFYCGNLNM